MHILALLLWTHALMAPASAQASSDQKPQALPVWCKVLPDQEAVSVEEPIWLHLHCENRGAEETVLDFQSGLGVGWRLSPQIATLSCAPHIYLEGVPPGRITVPAGGRATIRALLNRWSGKLEPGSYRLSLVSCVGAFEAGYKRSQSLSDEVTIEVLPLDAKRLESISKQLSQDALNPANSSAARLQAAEALGWIDLPIAVPYLQAVLLKAKDASSMLATYGLGRVGSPEAVRAMVDAYDKVSSLVQMEIRRTLTSVHHVELDPELRHRVDQILQQSVRFVD